MFVAILAAVPFIPTKKKARVQVAAAEESSDNSVQQVTVIEEVPVSEILPECNKEAEDDKPEDEGDTEAEHD